MLTLNEGTLEKFNRALTEMPPQYVGAVTKMVEELSKSCRLAQESNWRLLGMIHDIKLEAEKSLEEMASEHDERMVDGDV